MKKSFVVLSLVVFITLSFSCKKETGEGRNSSIYGKVYVKDYNSNFTILQDEYYGQDVDVFIVYGDEQTYGDKTSTNYDGTFEFKYLRPGTYHVYAYSKDSTLQTLASIPIIKDVEISDKEGDVESPEIIIFK